MREVSSVSRCAPKRTVLGNLPFVMSQSVVERRHFYMYAANLEIQSSRSLHNALDDSRIEKVFLAQS